MAVSLHFSKAQARAETPGTPLVMVHGLLGQGRNFGTLARDFSAARDVYTVDMRNHGDSPWDAVMHYPAMAEDLAAFIAEQIGGRALVFGHSMGGKAAMRLALDAPEHVAALIVADIAPVVYTHSHLDQINALRGLDLTAISRRSDADAALKMQVTDATMRAFLLQNLRISSEGVERRSNLDVLAGAMETLVGWDDPGGRIYDGPTLFIAGGESPYVLPEHHPAIHALFPTARIAVVPGAGHWIHAQKPKDVIALSQDFFGHVSLRR